MSFATNLAKIEAYVEQQGFTWQQVKNATPAQWKVHAVAAGLTVDELKKFSRMESSIRRFIVEKKKRLEFVAQVEAFLVHIRKAGTDEQTIPLMRELLDNQEDYYGS